MKTKHTRGEWSNKNGLIYRRDWRELYEYGGGLAGEKPIAYIMGAGFYTDEEIEANAKLISAAPDLLEAAIKVKNLVDDGRIMFDDSHSSILIFDDLIKAIKKATE